VHHVLKKLLIVFVRHGFPTGTHDFDVNVLSCLLDIIRLLIPHIIAESKCQALGGLLNADNRLAFVQGKASCGLQAGCWFSSRYAMQEHHHGRTIQREQTTH